MTERLNAQIARRWRRLNGANQPRGFLRRLNLHGYMDSLAVFFHQNNTADKYSNDPWTADKYIHKKKPSEIKLVK